MRAIRVLPWMVVLLSGCSFVDRGFGLPSLEHARRTVSEAIFLGDDRIVIRNARGEMFVGDVQTSSWVARPGDPMNLAVSQGRQLWGCYGTPGHADGGSPEAFVWHSADEGRNWTKVELKLPTGSPFSPAVIARLPERFINEPPDPPLLLMMDGRGGDRAALPYRATNFAKGPFTNWFGR